MAQNLWIVTVNVELPGNFLEKKVLSERMPWHWEVLIYQSETFHGTVLRLGIFHSGRKRWTSMFCFHYFETELLWVPSFTVRSEPSWKWNDSFQMKNYFGISYHRSFFDQLFSTFHFWNKNWKKNYRNPCKPALLAPHTAPKKAQPCPMNWLRIAD